METISYDRCESIMNINGEENGEREGKQNKSYKARDD